MKAVRAAVQQVAVLVAVERVADAVEFEARTGDPVRPAADRRAEVGTGFEVLGRRVVREHDIGEAPRAVGASHDTTVAPRSLTTTRIPCALRSV